MNKHPPMNIKPLPLLPPKFEGDRSVLQVFKERKSSREFSSKELPLQILSDLLWAANGINRPDSDHKTAPSAMNTQEIDIYLAKADGLYLFDAKQNILVPVAKEDMRALTGFQPFVKEAPLNLVPDLINFRGLGCFKAPIIDDLKRPCIALIQGRLRQA